VAGRRDDWVLYILLQFTSPPSPPTLILVLLSSPPLSALAQAQRLPVSASLPGVVEFTKGERSIHHDLSWATWHGDSAFGDCGPICLFFF
jgi:hypothetical protein